MLIISITIALAGAILSNQDGWGRIVADATLILLEPKRKKFPEARKKMLKMERRVKKNMVGK